MYLSFLCVGSTREPALWSHLTGVVLPRGLCEGGEAHAYAQCPRAHVPTCRQHAAEPKEIPPPAGFPITHEERLPYSLITPFAPFASYGTRSPAAAEHGTAARKRLTMYKNGTKTDEKLFASPSFRLLFRRVSSGCCRGWLFLTLVLLLLVVAVVAAVIAAVVAAPLLSLLFCRVSHFCGGHQDGPHGEEMPQKRCASRFAFPHRSNR